MSISQLVCIRGAVTQRGANVSSHGCVQRRPRMAHAFEVAFYVTLQVDAEVEYGVIFYIAPPITFTGGIPPVGDPRLISCTSGCQGLVSKQVQRAMMGQRQGVTSRSNVDKAKSQAIQLSHLHGLFEEEWHEEGVWFKEGWRQGRFGAAGGGGSRERNKLFVEASSEPSQNTHTHPRAMLCSRVGSWGLPCLE